MSHFSPVLDLFREQVAQNPIDLLCLASMQCYLYDDPRADDLAYMMATAPEVAETLAGEVMGLHVEPDWGTTIARMREWSGVRTDDDLRAEQEARREAARQAWQQRRVERPDEADRERRYGLAALDGACRDIANIGAGRTVEVNRIAWRVGQLVGGGVLEESEAVAVLVDAAIVVGLPEREARRVVVGAIKRGQCKPRVAPNGDM